MRLFAWFESLIDGDMFLATLFSVSVAIVVTVAIYLGFSDDGPDV